MAEFYDTLESLLDPNYVPAEASAPQDLLQQGIQRRGGGGAVRPRGPMISQDFSGGGRIATLKSPDEAAAIDERNFQKQQALASLPPEQRAALQQRTAQLEYLAPLIGKNNPDMAGAVLQSLGINPIANQKLQLAQQIANQKFNGPSKDQEAAYRRALENLGTFVNKKTGEPATVDFPDSSPDFNTLKNNYIQLKTTDQRNDLSALRNFDTDIGAYEELIKKLPLAEEEGALASLKSGLDIKALRLSNDPAVRNLDAIKARLISTARGFGGTSKSADSIREIDRLEKAVVGDFDSKAGAQGAIDELKRFRDSRAQTLPVPGLHGKYSGKAAGGSAPKAGAVVKGYKFKGGDPSKQENWEKE